MLLVSMLVGLQLISADPVPTLNVGPGCQATTPERSARLAVDCQRSTYFELAFCCPFQVDARLSQSQQSRANPFPLNRYMAICRAIAPTCRNAGGGPSTMPL